MICLLKKPSTLHSVFIVIKLGFNKYQNQYHYNMLLECKSNVFVKRVGIVDDSVIVCDKIISVIDSVLTNVTNTISS